VSSRSRSADDARALAHARSLARSLPRARAHRSPYDTHEFERRRQPDAPLSNLGQSQALTLPSLPHFRAVRLADLAKHSRVRLFCSPMTRALQTAEVLSRTLGVKTIVRPDLCEHGGYYSGWGAEAKSAKGPTRVELQRAFPDYDFSECGEDGWWNTQSPGFEEKDHYHKRIARVVEWLRDLAWQHRNHHHAAMADADAIEARSVSSDASAAGLRASPSGQHLVDQPDYAVIISHGDFLNTLLVHLLRMPPDSGYVFSHNNTGVTHLEFSFETKDGEAQKDKMHVRMITMNAPPLEVVGARRSLI
jgi:broad specificity phosphatase PhoE